jgi:hypothetical protein
MKWPNIMIMTFLSHLAVANAQGFFQYDRIDFFNEADARKKVNRAESEEQPKTIVDEWAEPVMGPSGKVSIYVPPPEVRDFLEKPDSENAKAYLEWNSRRIKKFILAQELLAKEAKKLGYMKEVKSFPEPDSSLNLKSYSNNIKAGASYLFYFMLKGCAVCEREARVIEDIYLNHPEIRIEAFGKGFSDSELDGFRFPARQDNGMSGLFKVTSNPSIAVFKNQRYFLSGFIDKERILGLFE